MTIMVRNRKL